MKTERRKRPETPYSMMVEKLNEFMDTTLRTKSIQARIENIKTTLTRMENRAENLQPFMKSRIEGWKKDLQAAQEEQKERSERLTAMRQKLEAAIERIPNEDYKTILRMKYFEGKTDADIADMQGLEYMKAKRKIRAAITKLAECGGL